MLSVAVVTLFPEMLEALTGFGITGRAARNGALEVLPFNPRDYAGDAHRSVDDRPYGGGPGMVMMVEPLRSAIRAARARLPGAEVICLSPQGRRVTQQDVRALAARPSAILVAGRYEGIDERLLESEVDAEWSIGDYVLSGGELPAMVLIDAAARLLPGTLGNPESARDESFMEALLDYPHYTRPDEIDGMRVPAVLLGGNHEQIRRWRLKQALGRTWERRPDLLEGRQLDPEQRALLEEFMRDRPPSRSGNC
jgi:tRNA (guanine37-N1)-methyltransferase